MKLQKGINVLYGANGSGKTTALEAIHILSLGKSFKTSTAQNYIRKNEKEYNIKGELSDKTKIEVKGKTTNKTILVNNQIIKKISNHISLAPTIIHTPEESVLEGKNNQIRNKTINKNLSLISQKNLKTLKTIALILKQRNAAIKANANPALWDKQLAENSLEIWREKEKYEKEINKNMEKINKKHNPNISTKIEIKGRQKTLDEILKSLEKSQEKDKEKGRTTIGPHQDKIKYFFNETEVKTRASQGEKTLFFSILKKSEANMIKEISQKEPVVLLDDIFSKLDPENRKKIFKIFKENTQTIITHSSAEEFPNTTQIKIND